MNLSEVTHKNDHHKYIDSDVVNAHTYFARRKNGGEEKKNFMSIMCEIDVESHLYHSFETSKPR